MVQPKREPRATWLDDEAPEGQKKRARSILRRLDRDFPEVKTALDFSNPLELLIATMLSAQSTDKNINKLTPALFAKYPTPEAYLASKPGELEEDVKSSGFFNQKAKNIRRTAQVLVEEFDSQVPDSMEGLLKLPGVARKTANVVLSNAFGIDVGIAVDTHVHRLSWRLALSDGDDPVKVERDLCTLFPKSKWNKVSHLLIEHGRQVCSARKPNCGDCSLARWCPSKRDPEA